MIKKIFILLINIAKAKIILKNPKQKDVVIFNSFQLNFYKDLFEKENYFCIEVPGKGSSEKFSKYGNKIDKIYISFSILKFILIEIFNNNFRLSYYLALIKVVKPKIIMTWVDNDVRFFKLAKILEEKIEFYAIQNAYRTPKEFPSTYISKIYIPNYLCFGEQTISYFNKIGAKVKKFNIVGSLRLSNAEKYLKENNLISIKPEYDLCIISENLRYGLSEVSEPNELKLIVKYAEKLTKKFKFRTILALKRPKEHMFYTSEINFYKNILNKDSPIIIQDRLNPYSSYKAAYNSRLIIATGSTILPEIFSKGKRILSCNYNKTYCLNYPDFYNSYFSISDTTYEKFEKRVLFLLSMTQEDFDKHSKPIKNYMVNSNENLSAFEKIKTQFNQSLKQES